MATLWRIVIESEERFSVFRGEALLLSGVGQQGAYENVALLAADDDGVLVLDAQGHAQGEVMGGRVFRLENEVRKRYARQGDGRTRRKRPRPQY